MTLTLAIAGLGTAVACALGTAILRRHAVRWGFVDVPNERSLHTTVMPRGGGVVIVAAVLAGLACLTIAGAIDVSTAAGFAALGGVVSAVGWIDDRASLPAGWRLLVHLAAAVGAVALWGAFDVVLLPGYGTVRLPTALAGAMTAVWIVGLLNAYNFMDGIDGLAAAVGVTVAALWLWAAGPSVPFVAGAGAIVAAACAGFLWHNWAPARIFMGDAGSGFLGFAFAVLPLIAFEAAGDARLPVAAVFFVAPFVFDTLLTFVRRLLNGENVLQAHRSHLYQRLVLCGWAHHRVAALYVLLTVGCGLAAVLWVRGGSAVPLFLSVAVLLLMPVLVARAEVLRRQGSVGAGRIRVK
jgi:Fuc2NAc and GlcNAc transferase